MTPRKATEDALAEALLATYNDRHGRALHPSPLAEAAAILDASPALTSMLLTGAAVEGLGDDYSIVAASQSRYGHAVHIEIREPQTNRGTRRVIRDTLPAAIAALGRIRDELGVPTEDYPAPVANAYRIADDELRRIAALGDET